MGFLSVESHQIGEAVMLHIDDAIVRSLGPAHRLPNEIMVSIVFQ